MKRYLIEGSYTDGVENGRTFLLGKGGYVVDGKPLIIDTYETEKAAKMVASKYNKRNEFESRRCKYIEPCRYAVAVLNY